MAAGWTARAGLGTMVTGGPSGSSGDAKESAAAYLDATKLLDRSGRKGLIHKNTAARQKSRLAKAIKK